MAAIIPAAAIGGAVGAELPNFFSDAFEQFGAGEGIYLRDGMPAGVVAKVGQAVGRAYCRSYDAVSAEYPPGKGERIEAACRPYLDSIGSTSSPGLAIPFEGGQCSQRYNVNFQVRGAAGLGFGGVCSGESITDGVLTGVWGPIGGVETSGQGVCTNVSSFTTAVLNCRGNGASPTAVPIQLTLVGGTSIYSCRITSLSLVSGGIDDCGNPPPETVTPDPTPNPQPPVFRFNPSPEINIDIDVAVNPDATITFNIGTGPITVDLFPDGDGDGPGGGGPGGGDGGPPPGDIGDPGDPTATGDGGDAEGEAGEGKVLVGLKIDILDEPADPNKYTGEVRRGVCYVYMGVPGNLDHDPGGAMLRSGQFIFAEKDNLTAWQVRSNIGYNLGVTPFYREVEL